MLELSRRIGCGGRLECIHSSSLTPAQYFCRYHPAGQLNGLVSIHMTTLRVVTILTAKVPTLAPQGTLPAQKRGALMRFGIVLFTSDRGITPAQGAQAAEEHGFSTFYVPEHTHIPVRRDAAHPQTGDSSLPDDRYMRTLDPWTSLASAAAVTSTIELSTAVALPAEHDTFTLAKSIATLDHISGGRVNLGVGFGWNTDELEDHGVPPKFRRTYLREKLEAMKSLWYEEEASYDGRFIKFGPSWAWPKPSRNIEVLVGAKGTDRTFQWIADNAEGWISTPGEEDVIPRVKKLQEVWTESGREGSPRITILDMRPDEERLTAWKEAGVTDVIYGMPDRSAEEAVAYLGRLSSKLTDMGLK